MLPPSNYGKPDIATYRDVYTKRRSGYEIGEALIAARDNWGLALHVDGSAKHDLYAAIAYRNVIQGWTRRF